MDEEKGIRSVYNPSDDQKKVIRMVYDRYRAMKESEDRQQAEKDWDKWEKQWEGWREPKGADDWQSNHTVPITLSTVETALSEIVKQNLRPMVLGRGLEDQMQAQVMQYVWDYAWDISDGDMTNYDALKDMLMLGTSIGQEIYRKDKRKVGSINEKGEVTHTEIYDYDDVCTEIVKLQDFYVDEFARSFIGPYAARDCVRRYIMNIDDFHDMYDGSDWDQYGDANLVRPGGDTSYYEFYEPPHGMDMSKRVEVLHYWNKPRDLFIIVANDVLIRNKPNPYKHKQLPFMRAVDVKRTHRFYGKGEPEILESIQDESNILRRMIIDRNHLDIDKMFAVSSRLGLSDDDLIARPHGMIPMDDPNGIKPIEYGDVPRSVELSLKHLEDDGTISTGINPRAQALPTAGTATEAAILKESTLRRIEMKIMLFKREYLSRLGKLRLANILQFYPEPKLEKIVGEDATDRFRKYKQDLEQKGMLQSINGQDYAQSYRQIGVQGKKVTFDAKGKMTSQASPGWNFFELRPDYFVPLGRAGYDIRFDAGANIEISKPLTQQKNLDLYDRVINIAYTVPGSYDPVKLGDWIIRDQGKNPDDLKPDQPQQDQETQRLQMQIQLASMENQMMLQGKEVPATAYASVPHTRIHVEFMHSPKFQDPSVTDKIAQIFTNHVTGELAAQEVRNMQGSGAPAMVTQQQAQPQQQPQQQQQMKPPNINVSIKADAGTPEGDEILKGEGLIQGNFPTASQQPQPTQPGQSGQGQIPQAPGKASVSNGITNRPGGMAQPATKVADVMPNLNTGRTPHL